MLLCETRWLAFHPPLPPHFRRLPKIPHAACHRQRPGCLSPLPLTLAPTASREHLRFLQRSDCRCGADESWRISPASTGVCCGHPAVLFCIVLVAPAWQPGARPPFAALPTAVPLQPEAQTARPVFASSATLYLLQPDVFEVQEQLVCHILPRSPAEWSLGPRRSSLRISPWSARPGIETAFLEAFPAPPLALRASPVTSRSGVQPCQDALSADVRHNGARMSAGLFQCFPQSSFAVLSPW
mmetsp:Transcript_12184/g.27537  ORF Transcript_12184/g.27537 Transcript_12184/m.27537 type:complete len:241 (-) Transcript_12184:823-1545(-)